MEFLRTLQLLMGKMKFTFSYNNKTMISMTVSLFLFQRFYSPCLDSTRWRYGPQGNTETIAKNLKIIQKEGKPLSRFCCKQTKSNCAFWCVGVIIDLRSFRLESFRQRPDRQRVKSFRQRVRSVPIFFYLTLKCIGPLRIIAERTRYIHVQCSLCFVNETN